MDTLVAHGLYLIRDQYFSDFPCEYWNNNKNENRPHYYLFRDTDGISWMIPMSTKADKYKAKIQKVEAKRGKGNCVYYHLGQVASVERAFLIGKMFPVDGTYVKAPWTIKNNHYVVKDKNLNATIRSKAMRYLKLLEQGVITNDCNILDIKTELLKRQKTETK